MVNFRLSQVVNFQLSFRRGMFISIRCPLIALNDNILLPFLSAHITAVKFDYSSVAVNTLRFHLACINPLSTSAKTMQGYQTNLSLFACKIKQLGNIGTLARMYPGLMRLRE